MKAAAVEANRKPASVLDIPTALKLSRQMWGHKGEGQLFGKGVDIDRAARAREGGRMNFDELKLIAKKHMGYSQFGYNQSVEKYWNMYKDTNGNIIYHTGKQGPEKGEKFNVTGTVKKQLVNKKGQKVTVIIRPRFKMIEQITEDLSIKDFPVMFKLKNTKWAMRMSKDLNRDGISASVENTVVTVNKPSFIIGPQVVQNTAAVYDAEQIFHYENH